MSSLPDLLLRSAGVACIPVSPFYAEPPPLSVVRFFFAKSETVLQQAAEKLFQDLSLGLFAASLHCHVMRERHFRWRLSFPGAALVVYTLINMTSAALTAEPGESRSICMRQCCGRAHSKTINSSALLQQSTPVLVWTASNSWLQERRSIQVANHYEPDMYALFRTLGRRIAICGGRA